MEEQIQRRMEEIRQQEEAERQRRLIDDIARQRLKQEKEEFLRKAQEKLNQENKEKVRALIQERKDYKIPSFTTVDVKQSFELIKIQMKSTVDLSEIYRKMGDCCSSYSEQELALLKEWSKYCEETAARILKEYNEYNKSKYMRIPPYYSEYQSIPPYKPNGPMTHAWLYREQLLCGTCNTVYSSNQSRIKELEQHLQNMK